MTEILVVEDDPDIRDSTAELLRARGYTVATLGDIKRLKGALRANPPDLVLQDCHMPGLDLAAAIREVRAAPHLRSVPILLYTASIEGDDFWRALGADGLVRKPFEIEELHRRIEQCLHRAPIDSGEARAAPR